MLRLLCFCLFCFCFCSCLVYLSISLGNSSSCGCGCLCLDLLGFGCCLGCLNIGLLLFGFCFLCFSGLCGCFFLSGLCLSCLNRCNLCRLLSSSGSLSNCSLIPFFFGCFKGSFSLSSSFLCCHGLSLLLLSLLSSSCSLSLLLLCLCSCSLSLLLLFLCSCSSFRNLLGRGRVRLFDPLLVVFNLPQLSFFSFLDSEVLPTTHTPCHSAGPQPSRTSRWSLCARGSWVLVGSHEELELVYSSREVPIHRASAPIERTRQDAPPEQLVKGCSHRQRAIADLSLKLLQISH